jgi:hypothetical protein
MPVAYPPQNAWRELGVNLDDYQPAINRMASECLAKACSSVQVLENALAATPGWVHELIALRRDLAPASELEAWAGFRQLGLFPSLCAEQRLSLCLVGVDIESAVAELEIKRECEEYDPAQPLFQANPGLFEKIREPHKKKEMVSFEGLRLVNDGPLVDCGKGLATLSTYLDPFAVEVTVRAFGGSPLFVRLHPYRVPRSTSEQLLCENIVRPADPRWIHELKLHKNTTTGSRYDLAREEDPWAYLVRGVRKLEVFAKREPNERFSMMVEELAQRPGSPILIGRCIHLDSDAPVGTPFSEVTLDHIDLAINVYTGAARDTRLGQNLAEIGKVVDAVTRTHLLRADKVPFALLFGYAHLFFMSVPLTVQWCHDQFGMAGEQ